MLQDDVLPGTSTVWEYLTFHTRLRLPAALSDGERAARVQAIIDQLSLGKVRANSVRKLILTSLLIVNPDHDPDPEPDPSPNPKPDTNLVFFSTTRAIPNDCRMMVAALPG